MDVEDVVAELVDVAPSGYVAARDARAAEARRAGDRSLADRIKRLPRPTAGAWLANLLAVHRASDVGGLVALGEAMRRAQEELSATELRQLGRRRNAAVDQLIGEAARLAEARGQPASGAALGELRTTLEAATADPDAASALATGGLARGLEYAGFGSTDLRPQRSAARRRGAGDRTGADGGAPRRRRASAEQAVETARQQHAAASGELQRLRRRAEEARRAVTRAEQEEQAAARRVAKAETALRRATEP